MRKEDKDSLIKKGEPKLGFFVYSSGDSGEDVAIRFSFLEWCQTIETYNISCAEARSFAKVLLEVVDDYEKGIETKFKA